MCTIAYWPNVSVHMTLDEARRIGNLNIDIPEIEIIKWRRKVRDAVRNYDMAEARGQMQLPSGDPFNR